jgi:hypothetical protein
MLTDNDFDSAISSHSRRNCSLQRCSEQTVIPMCIDGREITVNGGYNSRGNSASTASQKVPTRYYRTSSFP